MPLHQYKCKNCDTEMEILLSVRDVVPGHLKCGCGTKALKQWYPVAIGQVDGAGMSPSRTPGKTKS